MKCSNPTEAIRCTQPRVSLLWATWPAARAGVPGALYRPFTKIGHLQFSAEPSEVLVERMTIVF